MVVFFALKMRQTLIEIEHIDLTYESIMYFVQIHIITSQNQQCDRTLK